MIFQQIKLLNLIIIIIIIINNNYFILRQRDFKSTARHRENKGFALPRSKTSY